MLSWLKTVFRIQTRQEYINEYLSRSETIADLEQRIKYLEQKGYFY